MSKDLIKLNNEDWFEALITDCKATLDKAVFNSRQELIIGYHEVGIRILEENERFEKAGLSGAQIIATVAQGANKSSRTIYQAVQFARKFPDLDKLPLGKNISWHKIVNDYLPEPKNPHKCEFQKVERCKHCGKVK